MRQDTQRQKISIRFFNGGLSPCCSNLFPEAAEICYTMGCSSKGVLSRDGDIELKPLVGASVRVPIGGSAMFCKDKFRSCVDWHHANLDMLLPQCHGGHMACTDSVVGICNKTLDYWKMINSQTSDYESMSASGSWNEADEEEYHAALG